MSAPEPCKGRLPSHRTPRRRDFRPKPASVWELHPSWIICGVNALGTSGTRYFFPAGYVNAVAPTNVKRGRMPFRGKCIKLMLTNSTAGFSSDGTGRYVIAFCTVASDVATPTPLATSSLVTTARNADAVGDSGILEEGQEFAFQIQLSGTITNSPVDTFITAIFQPVPIEA
ncbi:hypothetical protein WME88_27460 [Sorangium sp. So ce216]